MNISSFVNQITQTITDAANENTGNLSPSALEESIRNGLEAILSKGSGQSVTGEVLQMNGNEILLSLGENQLLQARLVFHFSRFQVLISLKCSLVLALPE